MKKTIKKTNTYSAAIRLIMLLMAALTYATGAHAHSSYKEHVQDMYDVFGFEKDPEISDWMKYISSDLIDGCNKEKIYTAGAEKVGFYDYLKWKYPGFKCKHRLLFHWGYNSRPWNEGLQKKVQVLGWSETKIKTFQQEIINEQKRRNGAANARTERLFGFASSGKEASYARALISIAYDVHLLGDYTPDNKDTHGLTSLSSVVGDIINNLRVLDPETCRPLVAKLQKASKANTSDAAKAQTLLTILKQDMREMLRKHPDPRINRLILP